jgi:hypothetical protein
MIWLLVPVVTMAYCLARGAVDLRQRRYAWGAAGIIIGLALALITIPI